jgi:hypothetical protein
MEFFSGAAAFMLFCCVALRQDRSSSAKAQHPGTSEVLTASPSNRIIGIDLIACAWIAASVYCTLLLLTPPLEVTVWQVLAVSVPLVSGCAAIERWRWARSAMLGIAMVLLFDTLFAVEGIVSAAGGRRYSGLLEPGEWARLFSGFTGSPWFGVGVFTLAAVTVLWMSREPVRREFEHRKRAKTRTYQVGIAAVMVAVYSLGLHSSGLTHSIHLELQTTQLRHAADSKRMAAANRAFTNAPTVKQ